MVDQNASKMVHSFLQVQHLFKNGTKRRHWNSKVLVSFLIVWSSAYGPKQGNSFIVLHLIWHLYLIEPRLLLYHPRDKQGIRDVSYFAPNSLGKQWIPLIYKKNAREFVTFTETSTSPARGPKFDLYSALVAIQKSQILNLPQLFT